MSEFWKAVLNRRMLICIFTGFASGMPLYVLIQLVPAWLRSEGVGLKEIGFFALVGLPYTWKFIWAPLLDRYWFIPVGRRRTWMFLSQLALLPTIALLPFLSTETQLWNIAALALVVAFFSATQDIALDAYRRELLPDEELGIGSSVFVNAYRVSALIPGSLSLILADIVPWQTVFPVTAAFMLVGVVTTAVISDPKMVVQTPKTLKEAVIAPFKEFFNRGGIKAAVFMLAFIFFYKLGDNMATALATPFYLDMGYTLTEIGSVAKLSGFWSMIVGGMIGGLLMIKIGINRALWLFGLIQITSILGFAVLARVGEGLLLLGLVVGFEYLGVGLGAAAVIAFMARETSKAHTATQFALFSALAALPRTAANSTTGILVEQMGWEQFFYLCAFLAIPGMLLLFKVAPWKQSTDQAARTAETAAK